jgi:glycosyltransferase involved in cell wall biosynthesis
MRIAVNAIFLQKGKLEGYGWFVQEVFSRLANKFPEHEFVFVFDRPFDQSFLFEKNCNAIVVKPAARHVFAFKYWYDLAAAAHVRRLKADVWIQPYGFCSLTSSVPQLLIVHDISFKHFPKQVSWHQRLYYQWGTPRFLKKAKQILTVSEFSKQDILEHYPLVTDNYAALGTPAIANPVTADIQGATDKISIAHGAARPIFQPISWSEKLSTKVQFSAGLEYFLFIGGIHPRKNLMNLLKAFSLFKKWQKSNMKLLVAGRLAWQYEDLVEKLKSYKYRDDVVMLNYVSDEQLAKISASAYALIYPSLFEGFGLPILEAMQSGTPVICSNTSSMPEIAGEAALFADPNDPDAIAKQMLALYKDEALRNKKIEQGLKRAAEFNWDKTADQVWNAILKTVQ